MPAHEAPAAKVRVGDETAVRLTGDGAVCLFGLGPAHDAEAASVAARQQRVSRLLEQLAPAVRAVRWGQQVHGSLIASLSDEPAAPLAGASCVGRCDGLVTAEHGLGLLVWTADCVPVLLTGDGVIAAVHAGWRGVAAGIVPTCLRRLQVEYGVAPDRVSAWLGPAVGPCHYQVGPEVLTAFAQWPVPASAWRSNDRVDLRAMLTGQLRHAGVDEAKIWRSGACTACDPQLASYRRDGAAAGRQWSLISRPADSIPDDSIPDDSIPTDSMPDDTVRDDTMPDDQQ